MRGKRSTKHLHIKLPEHFSSVKTNAPKLSRDSPQGQFVDQWGPGGGGGAGGYCTQRTIHLPVSAERFNKVSDKNTTCVKKALDEHERMFYGTRYQLSTTCTVYSLIPKPRTKPSIDAFY